MKYGWLIVVMVLLISVGSFFSFVYPKIGDYIPHAASSSLSDFGKHACNTDADCVIANTDKVDKKDFIYNCCGYAGCLVDYSETQWNAVSKEWLSAKQTSYCPKGIHSCPIIPACVSRQIGTVFTVKCVENECQKVSQ